MTYLRSEVDRCDKREPGKLECFVGLKRASSNENRGGREGLKQPAILRGKNEVKKRTTRKVGQ